MRIFSEADIEKYLKYVDENVVPVEDTLGRCFICGVTLDEAELPEGPEKKVVCLKNRDYFVETIEGLVEDGELKLEK